MRNSNLKLKLWMDRRGYYMVLRLVWNLKNSIIEELLKMNEREKFGKFRFEF